MVEVKIQLNRVIENIRATGEPAPSLDDCKNRLQVIGFKPMGDNWRCPTALLQALDQSEFQLIETAE